AQPAVLEGNPAEQHPDQQGPAQQDAATQHSDEQHPDQQDPDHEELHEEDLEPRWLPINAGAAGSAESTASAGSPTPLGDNASASAPRTSRIPQPRPTALPATRRGRRRAGGRAERSSRRHRPGSAGHIKVSVLAGGLTLSTVTGSAI